MCYVYRETEWFDNPSALLGYDAGLWGLWPCVTVDVVFADKLCFLAQLQAGQGLCLPPPRCFLAHFPACLFSPTFVPRYYQLHTSPLFLPENSPRGSVGLSLLDLVSKKGAASYLIFRKDLKVD